MKIVQRGYAAMGTTKRGVRWFAYNGVRSTMRDARNHLVGDVLEPAKEWNTLRKEGWRIVPVTITYEGSKRK